MPGGENNYVCLHKLELYHLWLILPLMMRVVIFVVNPGHYYFITEFSILLKRLIILLMTL